MMIGSRRLITECMQRGDIMENETAVHLDGILSEFVAALNDEIQAIKSSGTSTTMLKEGHKIQSKG